MSDNIWYDRALDEASAISDSKRHDYASEDDPFLNFRQVADVSGLSIDQVFLVWVATKVVRLGQLIGGGKEPNNESVDDNILDLINYPALWRGMRIQDADNDYHRINEEADAALLKEFSEADIVALGR